MCHPFLSYLPLTLPWPGLQERTDDAPFLGPNRQRLHREPCSSTRSRPTSLANQKALSLPPPRATTCNWPATSSRIGPAPARPRRLLGGTTYTGRCYTLEDPGKPVQLTMREALYLGECAEVEYVSTRERDSKLHLSHRSSSFLRLRRPLLTEQWRRRWNLVWILRLFKVLDVERDFSQIVFARDMLTSIFFSLPLTLFYVCLVSRAHMPHQYDKVLLWRDCWNTQTRIT